MSSNAYFKSLVPKILAYKILGVLTLVGCAVGLPISAADAEGSQDLVSSGGDRPYLEFRNDTNGGIPRRTIIKAYAEVGETIDLGSSAVGTGGGIINYRMPDGTAGTCGAGVGEIANRAEEVAGPGDGTGGTFIPCTVAVTQTGTTGSRRTVRHTI
ncbi:MAG: hypothetical protein AAFS04_09045, partial [Cyanobacteria bacterium J06631_9]